MKKIIILFVAAMLIPAFGFRAVSASPADDSRYHFEQGLKYFNEKNLTKASEEWLQSFMIDGGSPELKEYFQKLYEQHFQSTTTFYEGRQLLMEGKIKEAETKFKESLSMNNGNDRANLFNWLCQEPVVQVTIPDNHFGKNNSNAIFKVAFDNSGYQEKRVDKWELLLMNTAKKEVRSIKGDGMIPDSIRWDATGNDQKPLQSSGKVLGTVRLDLLLGRHLDMKTNEIFYDNNPPDVSVTASSNFSPDSPDPKAQKIDFTVKAEDKEGPLKEVDLLIYKPDKSNIGKILKTIPTTKQSTLTWDGTYDDGSKVVGGSTVFYLARAYDLAMNKAETQPTKIDAEIYLQKEDRGLVMNLPNLEFDIGKDTLRPVSYNILQKVAKILAQYNTAKFVIEGHTDNIGTPEKNLDLSKKRAESVVKYLIDKYNVNKELITIKGYGQTKPIAPNNTESGRARNRRVEIIILSQ